MGPAEAPVTPELPRTDLLSALVPVAERRRRGRGGDVWPQTSEVPSPAKHPLLTEGMGGGSEEGKIITSQPLTFPASDSVINNPHVPPVRSISRSPNYFRLTLKPLPVPLSNK